jgi:hypothetical protein
MPLVTTDTTFNHQWIVEFKPSKRSVWRVWCVHFDLQRAKWEREFRRKLTVEPAVYAWRILHRVTERVTTTTVTEEVVE